MANSYEIYVEGRRVDDKQLYITRTPLNAQIIVRENEDSKVSRLGPNHIVEVRSDELTGHGSRPNTHREIGISRRTKMGSIDLGPNHSLVAIAGGRKLALSETIEIGDARVNGQSRLVIPKTIVENP